MINKIMLYLDRPYEYEYEYGILKSSCHDCFNILNCLINDIFLLLSFLS